MRTLTEQDEVFCEQVEERVNEQYDLDADAADLCFSLLERETIPEGASIDEAARIVAMHLLQA